MSALRRIASLHRELAQAYDDLDGERAGRRRKSKVTFVEDATTAPTLHPARPETRDRVRRGLRRAGVRP